MRNRSWSSASGGRRCAKKRVPFTMNTLFSCTDNGLLRILNLCSSGISLASISGHTKVGRWTVEAGERRLLTTGGVTRASLESSCPWYTYCYVGCIASEEESVS